MRLLKSIVPLTAVLALTFTSAVASPLAQDTPSGENSTNEISFEEAFGFTPDTIIEVEPGEELDLGQAVKTEQTTAGASRLAATRVTAYVNCTGTYDYPHAGNSSNYQAVNAHFKVKCTGTSGYVDVTTVRIQTRMTDHLRLGALNTLTGYYGYAFKGGDLRCLSEARGYQALGTAAITFPAGFQPQYGNFGVKSVTRSLYHNGSKCVYY